MEFSLVASIAILERTPAALNAMLRGLSEDWTQQNEGGDTWSAYDIIGHLVHGEKTDWVPRLDIILSGNTDKKFTPFDRFAQFKDSRGKTMAQLLDEFAQLRGINIKRLNSQRISAADLEKKGIHPAFGEVTLSQLLATWTVHDLNHIAQVARVMASQYKAAVGPWTAYLKILQA